MAVVVQYTGSNGDILIPITATVDNTSDLISGSGVYYIVETMEVVGIVAGNPMGLLLALTYPATP